MRDIYAWFVITDNLTIKTENWVILAINDKIDTIIEIIGVILKPLTCTIRI